MYKASIKQVSYHKPPPEAESSLFCSDNQSCCLHDYGERAASRRQVECVYQRYNNNNNIIRKLSDEKKTA